MHVFLFSSSILYTEGALVCFIEITTIGNDGKSGCSFCGTKKQREKKSPRISSETSFHVYACAALRAFSA